MDECGQQTIGVKIEYIEDICARCGFDVDIQNEL